jgi:AcrR family transcriptional regulator
VLKGSLYYYIDSKEDLLWAIVEGVHAQSSEILEQALALDASPIERIHIYIARHVEWYLSNVQDVSVFFREWHHLTGERLSTVKAHRRGYHAVVRGLIADAQAAGEASPDLDLTHATLYILAAVNSVPDWFRPGRGEGASDVAEAYANMTVGLLVATHATAAGPLNARTAA